MYTQIALASWKKETETKAIVNAAALSMSTVQGYCNVHCVHRKHVHM